jgi:hypothetical protein
LSWQGSWLTCKVDSGAYLLVPAVISAIVGGITSAWLFSTKIHN